MSVIFTKLINSSESLNILVMKELKIVAKIVVKKEFQEELEKVFRNLVDETRKEEGNISYELHQGIGDPLEYVILEVWKSQEAINFHNGTVHFLNFKNSIDEKINNLSIDVIQKVY